MISASDGDSRTLRPSSIMLLEDTNGDGYTTAVPGDVDYIGLGLPAPAP